MDPDVVSTTDQSQAGRDLSTLFALETQVAIDGASGLYVEAGGGKNELRIDVDGAQAQMTISGLVVSGLTARLHWIATVRSVVPDRYRGDIWFRDGIAALVPHQTIEVTIDQTASPRKAKLVFSGNGIPDSTLQFVQRSAGFHAVELEFDHVEGAVETLSYDTATHPNRPPSLPREQLTVATVFARAGFDITRSTGGNVVPLQLSGSNGVWSNSELHDAMQTYWSRFANRSQWAMWVLTAAQHEDGHDLGGIMFDDIGPNHRQGTAMFSNSFLADSPAGDPAPAAYVNRQRFWCVCHEMGHAFNLAHAWQKTLRASSWIPMKDEPEGRSFMNYPDRVAGKQAAFFRDFAFRFSDQELLFLRHAPGRFVEMGNAEWFEDHGFNQADSCAASSMQLSLRVNRAVPTFEFLEPCVIELKLANIGDEPVLVRERAVRDAERMVIIIRKQGGIARQWLPFASYCRQTRRRVLAPGEAVYENVFIGAGRNGWDLAEPGQYCVQALLRVEGEDLLSNPLYLTVRPPRSYEEARLAQDFFSDDVGRVLAFDGSRVLERANTVLEETAAQLPDRAVARHAEVALAKAMIGSGKVLALPEVCESHLTSAVRLGGAIKSVSRVDEGVALLGKTLFSDGPAAAETLGHIDFHHYADDLSRALLGIGDDGTAAMVRTDLRATLAARAVPGWVLDKAGPAPAQASGGRRAAAKPAKRERKGMETLTDAG